MEEVSELTLACQTDINSVTEGPLRRFIWLPRRVDSHPGHAGSSSGHENPVRLFETKVRLRDLHGQTSSDDKRSPIWAARASSILELNA